MTLETLAIRFLRRLPAALVFVSLAAAAPAPLEIVLPGVSQSDGGTPVPQGFEHVPGEVVFFSCQVAGYQKGADEYVHLNYTITALDPAGVPFLEPVSNEISEEVAPQDKEWKPRIRVEIPLPPLAGSGTYRIVVKVTDAVGKTSAEKSVPVEIRGRDVEPSETLTVRNFRFFRGEDDEEPLGKAVYRPGDPVWARFDVIGYRYGPKNGIDVSYGVSVVTSSGKTLWEQPDAAVEKTESFYPRRFVAASLSITLQRDFRPGEYAIGVQVKDAVGGQTYEAKAVFTVE